MLADEFSKRVVTVRSASRISVGLAQSKQRLGHGVTTGIADEARLQPFDSQRQRGCRPRDVQFDIIQKLAIGVGFNQGLKAGDVGFATRIERGETEPERMSAVSRTRERVVPVDGIVVLRQ